MKFPEVNPLIQVGQRGLFQIERLTGGGTSGRQKQQALVKEVTTIHVKDYSATIPHMFRDFRLAFRVLASRPAFTFVAALSLALGIGANSAIFGLIDAMWFRPLAVPNPGEIVRIFSVTDQNRSGLLSYPEYLDFKQQATELREVVATFVGASLLLAAVSLSALRSS